MNEEITSSLKDVDSLLESNAKLSISMLAVRMKQQQESTRELIRSVGKRIDGIYSDIEELNSRVVRIESSLDGARKAYAETKEATAKIQKKIDGIVKES